MNSDVSDVSDEKILLHTNSEFYSLDNNTITTLDDIDKIPKNTPDFQKIEVKLYFYYFLLNELSTNLRNKFGKNGSTLNGYLEGKIMAWSKELEFLHAETSLIYKGSFPRIDVLQRLHMVAIELETWPNFPRFKRFHLESIIRKSIGLQNQKEFGNYLNCITNFIERKNRSKIGFYDDYDMSGFKKTVEAVLIQIEKNNEK